MSRFMVEPIMEESLKQKKRKFLCKYCISESEIQHMVRPCLCKGYLYNFETQDQSSTFTKNVYKRTST